MTTLQREANRYFGYTAQETLNVSQSLYEKKLIAYPRTDSQFLTDDMEETVFHLITIVRNVFEIKDNELPDVKRIINSAKVTDHHALLPTTEIEMYDLNLLSKAGSDALKLIGIELLLATGKKHEYLETEMTVSCMDTEFKAKGKQIISNGWKDLEQFNKTNTAESCSLFSRKGT